MASGSVNILVLRPEYMIEIVSLEGGMCVCVGGGLRDWRGSK